MVGMCSVRAFGVKSTTGGNLTISEFAKTRKAARPKGMVPSAWPLNHNFDLLWPWPSTSWPPELIVWCPRPRTSFANLCQNRFVRLQNTMFTSLVTYESNGPVRNIMPLARWRWRKKLLLQEAHVSSVSAKFHLHISHTWQENKSLTELVSQSSVVTHCTFLWISDSSIVGICYPNLFSCCLSQLLS